MNQKIKIVVNGSLDIIHYGHLKLLEYAKSLYDNSFLLVLIDSDRRIAELKGSDRPVNNEFERKALLTALRWVDDVKIFDSADELITLIKNYQPDVMVKGSDYIDKPIIGAEYCKDIKFYERVEPYSTTKKIQSITNR